MRCSTRSVLFVAILGVLATACGRGGGGFLSPTAPTLISTSSWDLAPSANVQGTWQGNMRILIHGHRYDGPVELHITQQQDQSVGGHFRCLGDCGHGIGPGVDFAGGTVSGNHLKFSFDVPGEEAGTARWDFDLTVSDNTLSGRVHRYWISGIGSDDWGDIALSTGSVPPPDLPPPPTSYAGQWSGSGTGTSSAGTAARADVTFESAAGRISRLTVRFSIDDSPGMSPCGGTAGFGGGQIDNGAFTISGGLTFVLTVTGTFSSLSAASGTIQITPGAGAPASCLPASINWTATKGAAAPAPSTTTIGGRVSDATTGQLLSGVSVEVLGTNLRTTTDAAGSYRLGGIATVTFTVRYSRQGHATVDREYTLMQGTERLDLDTRLSPTAAIALIARDDSYPMARGSVLTIPAPGVLGNDSVPAGLTPSVRLVQPLPSNAGFANLGGGALRIELSGNPGFTGTITFRYEILAGATVSNAATVTITVN